MCDQLIHPPDPGGSWYFGIHDQFPSPSGALPQNHAVTCRYCEATHSPAPCHFRGWVWEGFG